MISVVIPHFNQSRLLRVCLETLHNQQGDTGPVEIIVVDNGSDALPDDVCHAFPDVTLLEQPISGPGPARNLGAQHASGHILAFIDSDCHAHAGWLACIADAFKDPDQQVIGGDVQVNLAVPGKPSFLESYEGIYSYRNDEHIAEGFSGTGNLAMRKEIFDRVGAFGGIGMAEDRDWGLRAGALGYRIRYVAAMIVYHPARDGFDQLKMKWNRHIAHDYEAKRAGLPGYLLWYAKAMALAVSPVLEIPTVLKSARISGIKARCMAFLCLAKVRLYRTYAMIRYAFKHTNGAKNDWSR